MGKSRGLTAFGISLMPLLIIANLLNLLFTISLTIEQIKTGWLYGTSLELGVLWPWLIELLCLPIVITGIVYFIINVFKRSNVKVTITNMVLFLLLITQYFLTNLFIFL